jgi:hypothetical protein
VVITSPARDDGAESGSSENVSLAFDARVGVWRVASASGRVDARVRGLRFYVRNSCV